MIEDMLTKPLQEVAEEAIQTAFYDKKIDKSKVPKDEKQVELDKVNSRLEKAERSLLSAGLTAPVAASSMLSRWWNQTSLPTWSRWGLRKRT